ncbi:MAG: RHS repeat-associated core domain-containing protein [Spirochaetaceae bacterium]|jgi:RHS repeat-associated protein|nr:RHS repeat-associated core domain-containing protein [Spirochaetaceae bacterium]
MAYLGKDILGSVRSTTSATGLYNYGYRDYAPATARFTTTDPVRDGNNWFAYVNNDPVNWVDLWGLTASDKKEFDEFMDFIRQQRVERDGPKDLFIHEKIAESWNDLPESVRNYEPGKPWGNFVDDLGFHGKNQRVDDGYHVTQEADGIYVHQDYYDPIKGPGETLKHFFGEVLVNPGNDYDDRNLPNWSGE